MHIQLHIKCENAVTEHTKCETGGKTKYFTRHLKSRIVS